MQGTGCSACSRVSGSRIYTWLLGTLFVALGSSRILLTKLSANEENKYDYLPTTVNVCSELVKLVLCTPVALWVVRKEGRPCRALTCTSWKELGNYLKWAIPAFLYFLDNLIVFYVLSYLQPVMAVLFSNFSIITTALLFRIVLKRHLSWVQWASLMVLFLSIVALTAGPGDNSPTPHPAGPGIHHEALAHPSDSCLLPAEPGGPCLGNATCPPGGWSLIPAQWNVTAGVLRHMRVSLGHVLIVAQCFISSLANIYNEKILKEGGQLTENIFVQNSKLYVFGTFFNGLTLALRADSRGRIERCGLFHGHNAFSVALIFITALQGLSVAFILKFRDNMFHILMAQVTTVIITAASILVFDFRPSLAFFLEAPTVLLSIFIYNASQPGEPLPGGPRRERVQEGTGHLWERSSGDGEELERLTKPSSDIDSDEDTL
ncbi:probable UDP-sugar transporter protein SLC35A5 [Ornithorhynchus anatinus]|uniref:Solute carrier family 35 member A5 n=1 Tax=Ornithorhynchus anatinus TaxID=9258 RepID=A0A6I8P5I6_ORNAN|nr:probable UDP-sugar transporter protein SLC35A5 [Ornithorhynchus anatinus]